MVPVAFSVAGGIASKGRAGYGGSERTGALQVSESGRAGASPGERRTVWAMGTDSLLRPVIVTLGLTDGTYTQIINGKLSEGDNVITGLEAGPNSSVKSTASTRAPGFGPGMGGGPPPPPR